MDPELASLTQSAGTTVVTLMATEAWQAARDGVLELWRRVQPGRAEAAAAQLDASREDALAAGVSEDQQTLSELRTQWAGLFRRLLVAHPEAAAELRALLDELQPPGDDPQPRPTVQHATASGHARIYQAGRDQHITES
ncbi:hypothetical protein AB0M29_00195 [Streptomyces sp. NPDC051976]|uniref:hypothetical protein n=1 Tax=Streptomyces sp. NPDC051976 TaxID=3154947 RepID=UPI003435D252